MSIKIEDLRNMWALYPMRMGEWMQRGLKDICNIAQEEIIASQNRQINTVCEVGSYGGEGMVAICDALRPKVFYSIDPYANGYDEFDYASASNMQEVERIFCAATDYVRDNFGTTVIKIKGTMQNLLDAALYADMPIDMFYVDGSHIFVDVNSDLICVRKYQAINEAHDSTRKTVLAGHDYGYAADVRAALDIHGFTHDKLLYTVDDSWIAKGTL